MKNIILSTIKTFIVMLVFAAIICLKTFILYDLCGFGSAYGIETIKMTIIISIILLSFGVLFKTRKSQIIYSLFISLILGIILFGNRIFFTYNKTFLSFFQIKSIGYTNEIGTAVQSLYQFKDIIFFIDNILAILVGIIILVIKIVSNKKIKNTVTTSVALKTYKEKQNKMPMEINKLIAILTFILILVFGVTCFINEITKEVDSDAVTSHGRMDIVKTQSIWHYYYYDAKLYFTRNSVDNLETNENIEEFFDEREKIKMELAKDPYANIQGLGTGKNIYIIQLESMQNFVINKKINGKEITPNLNKFAKENAYFNNFHSQSAISNTSDAEHSSATSLYPFANFSLFQFYDNYTSDNIYSGAKSKGYFAAYMHANVKYFWNREKVYKNMGVDVMENVDTYKDKSQLIHRWIADDNFLTENISKIKEYPKDKNKLAYMSTVSSHLPFNLDDLGIRKSEYVFIDVGSYKNTIYGDYLESANYIDTCFGNFINNLKREELYDDAIIITYGDHFGVPRDDSMYREDLLAEDLLKNIDYLHTNVPCIIKIPGINNLVINEAKSQLDIKPTVFKLIGKEERYSFGYDIFSKRNEVNFVTGNYISGDYIYNSANKTLKNYRSKQAIEVENLDKESKEYKANIKNINRLKHEIRISSTIVKNNYLKDKLK
ncbi:MAG: LTA synthase family protein [Clostridia bacterium]